MYCRATGSLILRLMMSVANNRTVPYPACFSLALSPERSIQRTTLRNFVASGIVRAVGDTDREETVGIAVEAASKVVQKNLDAAANQGIVDEYVNQAGGLD